MALLFANSLLLFPSRLLKGLQKDLSDYLSVPDRIRPPTFLLRTCGL